MASVQCRRPDILARRRCNKWTRDCADGTLGKMTLQVLLIEDDVDLAATVIDYVQLENIQVEYASNGIAGLDAASQRRFDTIILDVGLPRLDGLSVCQRLRKKGADTPVLMLTARDSLADKLAGFQAGTDDYLVKPFALDELVVRLHALAKRRSGQSRRLTVAGLVLDLSNGRAEREGQQLSLSPTGWILLEELMRASPGVVGRSQLAEAIWGDEPPDSNSLKVHIHRLRNVVESGFDRKLIHTIHGRGFALRGDDENQ